MFPTDSSELAEKKAKALAIFFCLMYDKNFEPTTMLEELMDMASDPSIAGQLVRIFSSYRTLDPLFEEIFSAARTTLAHGS